MLSLLSCTETTDLSKAETMNAAIHSLALDNARKLGQLKQVVSESGNRPLDLKLLNDLKAIVHHPLLSQQNKDPKDTINSKDFIEYADYLVKKSDDDDWRMAKSTEVLIKRIGSCKAVFLKSRLSLEYDFLRYNVYDLQKSFINDASTKVGAMIFDTGLLYINYASDTLTKGEVFKAIVTMRESLDEDFLEIDPANVMLTSEVGEVLNYTVENVGKKSWIFSFTPNQSGKYSFEFSALVHLRLIQNNPGYPYYVEGEFFVE